MVHKRPPASPGRVGLAKSHGKAVIRLARPNLKPVALIVAAVLALALACVGALVFAGASFGSPAQHLRTSAHKHPNCFRRYKGRPVARAKCLIDRVCVTKRVPCSWMHRVALCESRYNRFARNPSGASGLYQFMPGTWAGTPHGHKSIWSDKWQAYAAAWMYRKGRSAEWVCR